ncbi:hypothetical protein GCM10010218_30530 [Streptomyces mashuensis]|uniref:Uncharacterized protein n=1 Tax=Streptomyces mashuensis TaxID=33904 RepID=A0A919EDA3_9ACTN|nr:hypothetical protein [Streptomyces mashuensis]GHF47132.1 hypothetical protein GCM10010218_30530 [Streptomyces mashuensis]
MRKLTTAVALATAAVALISGVSGTAAAAPAPSPAPAPAQAPASAPPPASAGHLTLRSWTLLNEHGPGPNPGERLTAWVDARTVDGRTRGHAVVRHVFDGEGTVLTEFDVDCLTTDGSGAVTVTGPAGTAVATPADGGPPTTGPAGWRPETGLTFYPADEHGERRVGWAGVNLRDPSLPDRATKCTPVPASLWAIGGGTVVHK